MLRLADATGATVRGAAGDPRRRRRSTWSTRAASRCGSSRACTSCPRCPAQQPHVVQLRPRRSRGPTPRSGRPGARRTVQRLGHVVLQTTEYRETLDWYLDTPRPDRQRLPVLPRAARARAGDELHPLRPRRDPGRPPHPGDGARAGQPLRALGLPGRATSTRWPPAGSTCVSAATTGPGASAGTSRAARSSTTGATRTASWSSTSPTATCSTTPSSPAGRRSRASGLAQWGPPVDQGLPGHQPERATLHEARAIVNALRDDNEFDLHRLRGLLKVADS